MCALAICMLGQCTVGHQNLTLCSKELLSVKVIIMSLCVSPLLLSLSRSVVLSLSLSLSLFLTLLLTRSLLLTPPWRKVPHLGSDGVEARHLQLHDHMRGLTGGTGR